MKKIQTLQEMSSINSPALRKHLQNHMHSMFDEYGIDSMDSIGYYVILESDEYAQFPMSSSEFVEVLKIGEENYLHGVNVLSEDCAEDYYLPIEVVPC